MKTQLIIIAILVIAFGWNAYETLRYEKRERALEKELATNKTYTDSLLAAKTKVDTFLKVVHVAGKPVYLTPEPVDSIAIYEAMKEGCPEVYDRIYMDTITNKDFTLPYRLSVRGKLNHVRIGDYTINKETVHTSTVVNVPVEVIKEVRKPYLWAYLLAGNNFTGWTSWVSVDVGFGVTTRRGWGVMAGYQRVDGKNYGKFGFQLRLTK
jgi:hypothetical protein